MVVKDVLMTKIKKQEHGDIRSKVLKAGIARRSPAL